MTNRRLAWQLWKLSFRCSALATWNLTRSLTRLKRKWTP